jgi:hypothetical protein
MISTALTTFGARCDNFLLPTWHKYLEHDGKCQVTNFTFPDDLGAIILAIVEILLRIGTLAAVAFVIYGGFLYMTSQGEPDKAANARKTIINAVIGLVIAILATGVVSFIGGRLL